MHSAVFYLHGGTVMKRFFCQNMFLQVPPLTPGGNISYIYQKVIYFGYSGVWIGFFGWKNTVHFKFGQMAKNFKMPKLLQTPNFYTVKSLQYFTNCVSALVLREVPNIRLKKRSRVKIKTAEAVQQTVHWMKMQNGLWRERVCERRKCQNQKDRHFLAKHRVEEPLKLH